MRKLFYTCVVAVYLLLSSGMVLQLHYCMDRLAQVALFQSNHRDICEVCGMDMNSYNDCCHDRTDVIKLVLDQTHAPAPIVLTKPIFMAPTPDWSLIGLDFHSMQVNDHAQLAYYYLDKQRYRYRLLEVFKI